MKIAYVSPLPPLKSGIADYSQELLSELNKLLDIDLYWEDPNEVLKEIRDRYNVYCLSELPSKREQYEFIIYHIGNNHKFHNNIYNMALYLPGIIVMHDYSIHHLIAGRTVALGDWESYVKEMTYCYGQDGLKVAIDSKEGKKEFIWETDLTTQYPLNSRVINNSHGIIVHSRYMLGLINDKNPYIPITAVSMPSDDIELIDDFQKKILRERYNLPQNSIIIGSFGYVSYHKRIDKVMKALKRVIEKNYENKDIIYLIVGYSDNQFDVKEMSKLYDIKDNVIYIREANLQEFKEYIKLTDFCINLRYPTQGETSATLVRILGYGKPVIVTDIGSFREIPDDCSIKVTYGLNEVEELENAITDMIIEDRLCEKMGKNAYDFVQNNNCLEQTAKQYIMFIKDLYETLRSDDEIDYKKYDDLADILNQLGLKEYDDIKMVANKIEDLL